MSDHVPVPCPECGVDLRGSGPHTPECTRHERIDAAPKGSLPDSPGSGAGEPITVEIRVPTPASVSDRCPQKYRTLRVQWWQNAPGFPGPWVILRIRDDDGEWSGGTVLNTPTVTDDVIANLYVDPITKIIESTINVIRAGNAQRSCPSGVLETVEELMKTEGEEKALAYLRSQLTKGPDGTPVYKGPDPENGN